MCVRCVHCGVVGRGFNVCAGPLLSWCADKAYWPPWTTTWRAPLVQSSYQSSSTRVHCKEKQHRKKHTQQRGPQLVMKIRAVGQAQRHVHHHMSPHVKKMVPSS